MRLWDVIVQGRWAALATASVLLAVALIGPGAPGSYAAERPSADSAVSWVKSCDQSYFFTTRAALGWMPTVESQERRHSRKLAVDDPTHKATALYDKDVRSWNTQRPRYASWVTTLTTAAEPCTVLCAFLL